MRFLADTFDMLRDLAMVRLRVGHGGAILSPSREGKPAPVIDAGWAPPWRLLLVLALLLVGVEIARSVAAPLLAPLGLWLAALVPDRQLIPRIGDLLAQPDQSVRIAAAAAILRIDERAR